MSRLESWLTTLAAYGCDIYVHGKQGAVPLWRSHSSYDAAGLDLLVQRSKDWYTRRGEQRRIKPGDRLAVLGHGIAVVEQAHGEEVHAVLWNRDRVRVERKQIIWDEGNNRWETTVVAATSSRTPMEH